jgi:hypothetical protein
MLSQRISSTTCQLSAGIMTEDAEKYLRRSVRDYRRILTGLVAGDDGLGIYGPESDATILRQLTDLNDLWSPLDAMYGDLSNAAATATDTNAVATAAADMLSNAKQLVGLVAGEYSEPSQMLQADAVLIQIAERQRMLEQIVANSTCLIAEGIDVDTNRDALASAITLYDESLSALRNGLEEVGIAPPPTKAIDLWLDDIHERWSNLRPTLESISTGADVTDDMRTLVFDETNKLTWMMNVTVGQYTEASKFDFNR